MRDLPVALLTGHRMALTGGLGGRSIAITISKDVITGGNCNARPRGDVHHAHGRWAGEP